MGEVHRIRYSGCMLLLILLILIATGLGAAVLSIFLHSPEGYEDEQGFHYGQEPRARS